jgi:CSLREA domain-containing protein
MLQNNNGPINLALALRTILILTALALSGHAGATFYTITDLGDDLVSDNGTCQLREAIIAANENVQYDGCPAGSAAQIDRVVLIAGTYVIDLSSGANEEAGQTGDLDIAGDLVIEGLSPRYTIIDGGSATSIDRVFDLFDAGAVTIRGLAITGGGLGNLRSRGNTTLNLIDVDIRDGRGPACAGVSNSGVLTLLRSRVHDNHTMVDAGSTTNAGGGICSDGVDTFVLDSTISNNQADDAGGGIFHDGGNLVIYRSVISENTSGSDGGGLWIGNNCDIQASTIEGNDATRGGGMFVNAMQCVTLTSAFLDNTATQTGGGLHAAEDTFVRRSTFAGNSAVQGGGVYSNTGMTLLDGVTIAQNLAGGGIFNEMGISVEVALLASNAGGNCLGLPPLAGAFNLDDANTCEFVDDPGNDQPNFPNTDPLLGPLANNGGLSPTFALLPGSPAIDAVSSDIQMGCQNDTDQRGYPRGRPRVVNPDNSETFFCDIGAYEAVAPYLVTSAQDETDVDPDDDICLAASGACTLRAAVQQANATPGREEIQLPPGVFALALAGAGEDAAASGDLDLTDDVVIQGAGRDNTSVDGNGLDRVFDVFQPPNGMGVYPKWRLRVFRDLTIEGGLLTANSDHGGGIRATEDVLLQRAHVTDNEVSGSADGGGIYCSNDCWLQIRESEVSANRNSSNGGGIFQVGTGKALVDRSLVRNNLGGIGGAGETNRLELVNSTVANNEAGSSGAFFADRAVIEDSTIFGNLATGDSGAFFILSPAVMRGSIVAENSLNGALDSCTLSASVFRSFGYNLTDTLPSDCLLDTTTDINQTGAELAPLAQNGGPTATMAPYADSLAIDGGDVSLCSATDQRGVTRPQDGDGDLVVRCDIGAYEAGDIDGDGVGDIADNCLLVANPGQADTNGDGFGNLCDGDFNDDCSTNAVDLGIIKANFFAVGALVTDMNNDGVTNVIDLGLLKEAFFAPPGPSGVRNGCDV